MIEKFNKVNGKPCYSVGFKTISEFEKYITTQPVNSAFQGRKSRNNLISTKWGSSFSGTESFEEAVDLLHNGWQDKSQELVKKLKVVERDMAPVMKQQRVIGVAGYQPIVPLFLMGVPAAMASTKMQPVKRKVVTVVKSIGYPASTSTSQWTEQSVKALSVVKKLESNGYRVNVDVIDGGYDNTNGGTYYTCRVRVKNANERLNISKMAFSLCHPSIERRLFFRFEEVYPKITSGFSNGYGKPMDTNDTYQVLDKKSDVLLPMFINGDIEKVKSIDDIRSLG